MSFQNFLIDDGGSGAGMSKHLFSCCVNVREKFKFYSYMYLKNQLTFLLMNVKCLTLGMLNWQVKLIILNFWAYCFNTKFPILIKLDII